MKTFLKIFIATVGFYILLSGCSSNSNRVVKLIPTLSDSLTFTAETQIVKLETSPGCNFGIIDKVLTDNKGNRIIIASDDNLYIFDGKGKFLCKLKQGKGPNEVSRIMTFSINKEKELIYAVDMASLIVVIDYDGNIIDKFSIRDFCSIDIFCLDDNNLLLFNNWVGRNEKKFVGKYSIKEQRIVNKYVASDESNYPINTLITAKNFSNWNNKLYFYTPNAFSLFEYSDGDFIKQISFDLGDRSVPKHFYKQFQIQNRDIFREEAKNKGFVPFMLFAIPFEDYYLVGIDDEKYSCYAISKDDYKNIYQNGSISTYFNLPKIRSLRSPSALQDDCIIFVCNPMDFFENDPDVKEKEISIGNQRFIVNYNDNPFIITITSKKVKS